MLLTLLTGCRSGPGPADDEPVRPGRPTLDTPYQDEQAGREVAEEAEASMGIVDSPALAAYVEAIGRRLARHAPGYRFDYRFQIIDEDTPNAFALPGGFIFVSRGALALSNSEDELAGVLGHEIAHVASRHAAARQRVGGGGLLALLQQPHLSSYSRDLERTADRIGQGLAAVAGYDPNGIVGFLRGLDGLERARTGGSRIPSFLATHPGTVTRTSDASQRAQIIAWKRRPGVARDRADHLRRLDGLVAGGSAAQGVFDGSRFLHPDLGFTLRFPEGWETRNTPRAVGAIAPSRDGQILLEHAGQGSDVAAAEEAWVARSAAQGLVVREARPVKIGGREARRLRGTARVGGASVGWVATFIPWRGGVLRLIGFSAVPSRHDPLFLSTARTFRPMTRELLARVQEQRVRVVVARPGEALQALSRRTGNRWSIGELAVMNGVFPDARFEGGEPVKIARAEPYTPPAAR